MLLLDQIITGKLDRPFLLTPPGSDGTNSPQQQQLPSLSQTQVVSLHRKKLSSTQNYRTSLRPYGCN